MKGVKVDEEEAGGLEEEESQTSPTHSRYFSRYLALAIIILPAEIPAALN